jgi:hypothetical protein
LTEENVEAVAALNRSITKASQSVIGVSGLFLLGGKRDQRAGCIERAYLDDTSDDGGMRKD